VKLFNASFLVLRNGAISFFATVDDRSDSLSFQLTINFNMIEQ
jgi:hypothetical protein